MHEGHSSVLYKRLDRTIRGRQSYISATVLSFVRQGMQQISDYEGERVQVRAGEWILIPKGIYTVSDIWTERAPFEAVLFFLHDDLVDVFLKLRQCPKRPPENDSFFLRQRASPQQKEYLQTLLQLYRAGVSTDPALLPVQLQELLHLLANHDECRQVLPFLAGSRLGKRRNLRSFLEAHYDKPLKVEDYAYLTGRSLSSFRRDFKELFVRPPQQWLKDRRLKRARELLLEQKLSVTETAYAIGYSNISYFIREFKKRYGCTPKQL